MENVLTFSTSQLFLFLAALPVFITAIIVVKKYLISKFRTSFDFNASHYLIGLAVSLSTSIALINWETYDSPIGVPHYSRQRDRLIKQLFSFVS